MPASPDGDSTVDSDSPNMDKSLRRRIDLAEERVRQERKRNNELEDQVADLKSQLNQVRAPNETP